MRQYLLGSASKRLLHTRTKTAIRYAEKEGVNSPVAIHWINSTIDFARNNGLEVPREIAAMKSHLRDTAPKMKQPYELASSSSSSSTPPAGLLGYSMSRPAETPAAQSTPTTSTPISSQYKRPSSQKPHESSPYEAPSPSSSSGFSDVDLVGVPALSTPQGRPRQRGEGNTMISESHRGERGFHEDPNSGYVIQDDEENLLDRFSSHMENLVGSESSATRRNLKIGGAALGAVGAGLLAYGGYKWYKKNKAKREAAAAKISAPSHSLEATSSPSAAPSNDPASCAPPQAQQATPAGARPSALETGPEPPGVGTATMTSGGADGNAPLVQQIHDAQSIAEQVSKSKECEGKMAEEKSESEGEEEQPMGQEKATGPDYNRLDPITPATGSKQTTDTANSVAGPKIVRDMTAKKVASQGLESVYGNARERANMGKGALDGHSFAGPYDYPIYPGGRPDDTLTGMGAWRTRNGNHSSLWFSRKTAKGMDAKRNKYFKWSTKAGGNWRKLNKDEMLNVFQKPSRLEGGNFYGVVSGVRFRDLIHQQLAEKEKDIAVGKVGARKAEDAKMGFLSGQRRGAKRRKVMGYDGSAHQ